MTMIETKSGLRRENPEITARKEKTLEALKKASHRVQLISTLDGHPGWSVIQEIISEKLKPIETMTLEDFHKMDRREQDLMMQKKEDLVFFRDIVKDFTESVKGMEQAMTRLEKELAERNGEKAL